MLTVVALEGESTHLQQAPAVAAAVATLASRQEVALVSEWGDEARPGDLTRELRAALPDVRLIRVTVRSGDDPGSEIELIGGLLERGAMPLVLAPPGSTKAVAATLADKLSATALLRLTEPGLAGNGRSARQRGRQAARAAGPRTPFGAARR